MNTFQSICFLILVLLFFYLFYIRPIMAIGDLPSCIDRLTEEVKELKEVLKNDKRRNNN